MGEIHSMNAIVWCIEWCLPVRLLCCRVKYCATAAAPRQRLFLLLILTLPGCGYTSTELFPEKVRTVAVPIFQNNTFYREMEFDLTDALIKEIELRTPYKVTDQSVADTILQGEIVSVDQTRLSRQAIGGVPQELELRVTVDFIWKNINTGELLRERKGMQAVGRYIPTRPISELLTVSQHQANERLATRIVSVMADNW